MQVGMAVAVMRGAAPEECLTLALKSSAGEAMAVAHATGARWRCRCGTATIANMAQSRQ
jgi:hypothetical protein